MKVQLWWEINVPLACACVLTRKNKKTWHLNMKSGCHRTTLTKTVITNIPADCFMLHCDWLVCCLLAGPDLWKCPIAIVFTCPLRSWCKFSVGWQPYVTMETIWKNTGGFVYDMHATFKKFILSKWWLSILKFYNFPRNFLNFFLS